MERVDAGYVLPGFIRGATVFALALIDAAHQLQGFAVFIFKRLSFGAGLFNRVKSNEGHGNGFLNKPKCLAQAAGSGGIAQLIQYSLQGRVVPVEPVPGTAFFYFLLPDRGNGAPVSFCIFWPLVRYTSAARWRVVLAIERRRSRRKNGGLA